VSAAVHDRNEDDRTAGVPQPASVCGQPGIYTVGL